MTKDRFIVEKFGGCWHEENYQNDFCKKCGVLLDLGTYNDLENWEGFGWLWERMQKHERWWEFLNKNGWVAVGNPAYPDAFLIDVKLINPLLFRDKVAEFFGWEEEK